MWSHFLGIRLDPKYLTVCTMVGGGVEVVAIKAYLFPEVQEYTQGVKKIALIFDSLPMTPLAFMILVCTVCGLTGNNHK